MYLLGKRPFCTLVHCNDIMIVPTIYVILQKNAENCKCEVGHHFLAKNISGKRPKSTKLTEYLNFGKLQAILLSC